MNSIALFTVTYRADDWTDEISVEVFASDEAATARRDALAEAGIYALVAEQGMEIFQ